MDTLFGTSWKTSVLSFLVSFGLYFNQVGIQFPETGKEWGAAIVAALIFAWGRMQKDADQTGVAKV